MNVEDKFATTLQKFKTILINSIELRKLEIVTIRDIRYLVAFQMVQHASGIFQIFLHFYDLAQIQNPTGSSLSAIIKLHEM